MLNREFDETASFYCLGGTRRCIFLKNEVKMGKKIIEDQSFKAIDYSTEGIEKGEYDHCTFSSCIFQKVDLSEIIFSECHFEACDLSMALLKGTAFRTATFKNCKLMGLRFDDCNPFLLSLSFEGCLLQFSSFYGMKLKKTPFKNCNLEAVEFVEADLTNASFEQANLSGAIFERTILEKADFRTALHFSIDPEANRMTKARFSSQNSVGLLHKYKLDIEGC
jgi:fluoroquinolone resistance protein